MSRGLVSLGLVGPEPEEPLPDDGTPGPISPLVGTHGGGRGGIAVSTVLHFLIIALVVDVAIVRAPPAPKPTVAALPSKNAVFMPPPATVRKMLGLPPARPVATPPPPSAKDRISIGPPSEVRRERIELHRDDDLTKFAKGSATGASAPRPVEAATPPPPAEFVRDAGTSVGDSGRLAPRPVRSGSVPLPGPIHAALERFETTAVSPGALGVASGTGGQMGPLDFDPQGADFTLWLQRFVNEVYRNWILPPSAIMGLVGEVPIEFVVDREGKILEARILESSGVGAYDRAARNALLASRFLPLPKDYRPATVTMRANFIYNRREGGRGGQ